MPAVGYRAPPPRRGRVRRSSADGRPTPGHRSGQWATTGRERQGRMGRSSVSSIAGSRQRTDSLHAQARMGDGFFFAEAIERI
jgi:hypothetical protein